jgi:hypothetical protein
MRGLSALGAPKYTNGGSQYVFTDSFEIVPGSPLERPVRAIRCGTGGELQVVFEGGDPDAPRTVRFTDGETRLMRVIEVQDGDAADIEGLV